MTALRIESVPIGSLIVSPYNARESAGDITELANSIKAMGPLQPIIVREVEGRLEVVVGQRRFLACKSLGWDTIPAVIRREMTDREAMLLSLTENVQIDSLDPIERAEATKRLIDDFARDMSRSEAIEMVADRLGKATSTIQSWLALLRTTEAVRQMIRKRRIDTKLGARLAGIEKPRQEELAMTIAEAPISRREALQAISYAKRHPEAPPREAVERFMEQMQEFSITVSLPGSLYSPLAQLAEAWNTTIQEAIRRAIRYYLKAQGRHA